MRSTQTDAVESTRRREMLFAGATAVAAAALPTAATAAGAPKQAAAPSAQHGAHAMNTITTAPGACSAFLASSAKPARTFSWVGESPAGPSSSGSE